MDNEPLYAERVLASQRHMWQQQQLQTASIPYSLVSAHLPNTASQSYASPYAQAQYQDIDPRLWQTQQRVFEPATLSSSSIQNNQYLSTLQSQALREQRTRARIPTQSEVSRLNDQDFLRYLQILPLSQAVHPEISQKGLLTQSGISQHYDQDFLHNLQSLPLSQALPSETSQTEYLTQSEPSQLNNQNVLNNLQSLPLSQASHPEISQIGYLTQSELLQLDEQDVLNHLRSLSQPGIEQQEKTSPPSQGLSSAQLGLMQLPGILPRPNLSASMAQHKYDQTHIESIYRPQIVGPLHPHPPAIATHISRQANIENYSRPPTCRPSYLQSELSQLDNQGVPNHPESLPIPQALHAGVSHTGSLTQSELSQLYDSDVLNHLQSLPQSGMKQQEEPSAPSHGMSFAQLGLMQSSGIVPKPNLSAFITQHKYDQGHIKNIYRPQILRPLNPQPPATPAGNLYTEQLAPQKSTPDPKVPSKRGRDDSPAPESTAKRVRTEEIPSKPKLKKWWQAKPQAQERPTQAPQSPILQSPKEPFQQDRREKSPVGIDPPTKNAHMAQAHQPVHSQPPHLQTAQPPKSRKRDRSQSPEQGPAAKRAKVDGALPKPQVSQQRPQQLLGRTSQQPFFKQPKITIGVAARNPDVRQPENPSNLLSGKPAQTQEPNQPRISAQTCPSQSACRDPLDDGFDLDERCCAQHHDTWATTAARDVEIRANERIENQEDANFESALARGDFSTLSDEEDVGNASELDEVEEPVKDPARERYEQNCRYRVQQEIKNLWYTASWGYIDRQLRRERAEKIRLEEIYQLQRANRRRRI